MLKDIWFGRSDSKNELINDNEEEHEAFINGFEIPPTVDLTGFFNGTKYFALGMKGSGKTALLRYIGVKAYREDNNASLTILFKSDFTTEEKSNIWRYKNLIGTDVSDNSGEIRDDFEDVWRWFLYRKIVDFITSSDSTAIKIDANFEKLSDVVNSPLIENFGSGISRLFPKLKRGCVEISKDPSLKIDFEWENESERKVKFRTIVSQADNLFNRLNSGENKLYVLLDELELSYQNKESFKKDSLLIRDLVVTCDRLNRICRQKSINVYFIASIRTEVLRNIYSIGKEINKPVYDFGVSICWHNSNSHKIHPLIKIIINRLRYFEIKTYGVCDKSDDELWLLYFPSEVNGKNAQQVMLDRTWYRPRDIVRMLNLLQEQFPKEQDISVYSLQQIRVEYAHRSWEEFSEELIASYSPEEIDGLQKLLMGLHSPFWLGEFNDVISRKSEIYPTVKALSKSKQASDILCDLFRIGVLGNLTKSFGSSDIPKFHYRGEPEIDLEREIITHHALWKHFNFKKREGT